MKEWCLAHPILTFIIIFLVLLEIDCYIGYLNNKLRVKLTIEDNKEEINKNTYTTYGSNAKIKHNI